MLELRAQGRLPEAIASLDETLLQLQRDLFVVGAELASNADAQERLEDGLTRVDEPMLDRLEAVLAQAEAAVEMPREFTVPGADRLSAALELARAIVRRAERRVTTLERDDLVPGDWSLPYLNRLADLLWVLARQAEHELGTTTTRVRGSG
mgnify:CR=1 FL=1